MMKIIWKLNSNGRPTAVWTESGRRNGAKPKGDEHDMHEVKPVSKTV